MYTVRINNRLPQAYRICKAAPASYNTVRDMALFPRLIANEFAPMFRLMDDYASHVATRGGFNSSISTSRHSFNPRFDVKETSEAYELQGELPGIDHNDINIEFTDPQTLSIKGRSETHREEGKRPTPAAAAIAGQQNEPAKVVDSTTRAASETDETAVSETSSYHKATVEDEIDPEAAETASVQSTTEEKPADSTTVDQRNATVKQSQEVPQQEETSRYWVSERSVGTFQRSFAFPARVDQENVKASLSNGILSILIPKATVPASRRIYIQ